MSDSTRSPALAAALEQARTKGPEKPGVGKTTLGLAGALLVVAGFTGGYVAKSATAGGADGPQGMVRMGGPGGGQGGGAHQGGAGGPQNLTIGTITKVDGNTVTIKTTSGNTVKATVGSDTNVNISTSGSVKDLATGDEIVVNGQRDGDTIDAEFVSKGRAFGPRVRSGESANGG
jgi:hypothetical protein